MKGKAVIRSLVFFTIFIVVVVCFANFKMNNGPSSLKSLHSEFIKNGITSTIVHEDRTMLAVEVDRASLPADSLVHLALGNSDSFKIGGKKFTRRNVKSSHSIALGYSSDYETKGKCLYSISIFGDSSSLTIVYYKLNFVDRSGKIFGSYNTGLGWVPHGMQSPGPIPPGYITNQK